MNTPVGPNEFILDNGSQVSLARPEFQRNLEPHRSGYRGVGGEVTKTYERGTLDSLATCLASPNARLNVLSFGEVEENNDIEYVPNVGFRVYLQDGTVVDFEKRDRLYFANLKSWKYRSNNAHVNVVYNKRERTYVY